MRLPKMVLFDYGNTLIHEDPFVAERGYKRLLEFAVKNPDGVTAAQLTALNDEVYSYLDRNIHGLNVEVNQCKFFNTVFETLGLEFDRPNLALEIPYWDAATPCHAAPNIDRVMHTLARRGIRTGVVSNISFSRETMVDRLDRYIPDNRFEFVVTSSEYGFRKPSAFLFRAALKKAGLAPEDIWFCGDNPVADVAGSSAVGMFPVWYQSPLCYSDLDPERVKGIEHLFITDWRQFLDALERL